MTDGVATFENRAQRRASKTLGRLMAAALSLFGRQGVSATTVEDITEEADVGKGTFYRHFASKDAVLEALVEQSLTHLIDCLRGTAVDARSSLAEVLGDLLAAHERFHRDQPTEFGLVFHSRRISRLQDSLISGKTQQFSPYFEELQRRLAPWVPVPMDLSKLQNLALAISGFVSGFYSLSAIGMTPQEIDSSLQPLKQALLARAQVYLSG
jgi:AcrR family transcriptional regulator